MLVPAVGTAYVLWLLFIKIDSILPLPIPGLGFAVTLTLIVLVGALASNVVGKRFFLALERLWPACRSCGSCTRRCATC